MALSGDDSWQRAEIWAVRAWPNRRGGGQGRTKIETRLWGRSDARRDSGTPGWRLALGAERKAKGCGYGPIRGWTGSIVVDFGKKRVLDERTRVLLTSAAYVHLKHFDVSKHTRNLSPASRAILLSGPAGLYQQMLARALAHHFEAKLLLLDLTDFSLKELYQQMLDRALAHHFEAKLLLLDLADFSLKLSGLIGIRR
ncbi:hypothetical protein CASFOL_013912 [Castilleja foliolosa]|uniref:ATPase AAA-type core domain-containing protein n=1 Tax=Castilleja foliolosa TaxID=1961234 RepID=A0ABD3DP74_9LAMI